MDKEEQITSISSLAPAPGSRKKRKRVGCGEGSGNGKTCGKGHKGQRSRSGFGLLPGFEGGQMPIHRRLPKRGFVSRKKVLGKNTFSLVPLARLAEVADGKEVTLERMLELGLVRSKNSKVKIVSGSALQSAIVVEAHAVTSSVKEAIGAAGGEVRIIKQQAKNPTS